MKERKIQKNIKKGSNTKHLNPGSSEALDNGCKCPVLDNHYGKGRPGGVFVMNQTCPIHGFELPTK